MKQEKQMTLTRRQVLAFGVGAAAFGIAVGRVPAAMATPDDVKAKINDMFGGVEPQSGTVTLSVPEIAENGNTVPISVSVDSAMQGDDLVQSVTIFADGNPSAEVAVFHFTALSGVAEATTRIRLAKTQNVIAVAKMANGDVFMDSREIKVTIGGCGG